jgi:hypothetical protein
MHTTKKEREELQKEKLYYKDLFLAIATLNTTRQHQKSSFSISDIFNKGTEHKRCRRPIKDLRFSPEKSHRSQTMSSA